MHRKLSGSSPCGIERLYKRTGIRAYKGLPPLARRTHNLTINEDEEDPWSGRSSIRD
jgi:hypothetical protein